MIMKYYRNYDQVQKLVRDYQEEIIRVNRLLETEEDLKRRSILQEGLAENMEAKKRLERFLDDNGDMFKWQSNCK